MSEIEETRRVRDEWCAEYVKARDALKALVERLDEINADPEFAGVWTFYAAHGMRYNGPTWVDALARARAVVGQA